MTESQPSTTSCHPAEFPSFSGRRNRGRRRRATWLAQPTDSWPPMTKTGLSMALMETQSSGQCFRFEHNQQYQRVQFQFLDAVESLSHENIMALLQMQPYHIDSLLQLGEVCRISEDMQMAAELTARALYSFEMSFHPMFSLTTGTCRLDFKYPENRSFYLAIFRHLTFVGQRGCYRTAMEFSKLLLSFDPDGDPMGVLLMIDFYALRAEMYSYLVRMSQEWTDRNLSQLPNFAFSIPLAMYHLAVQNSEPTTKADEMIQTSVLMFPSLLMPLLDKCSITPDKQVSSHSYFGVSTQYSESDGLKKLISLYVCRCFSCWKNPDVMQWLEENVKKVLKRVDANDPLVPEFAQKRKTRYQRTPRNVYRHIIISEIKDATAALPPDLMNTPVLSYDPVPPADSVTSYTRPRRPTRLEQDGNPLSTFLRSILPNFNPEEPAPEEGAVGGENANSLRQGIGVLMEAMRDLLNNIRPVEPPIENPHEGADNSDDENLQEWD